MNDNGLMGSAPSGKRFLMSLRSTPADKICPLGPLGFMRLLKSPPPCVRAFVRTQKMSPPLDIYEEELRSEPTHSVHKREYLDIHGLGLLRGLRSEYKRSQSFAPSEDIFGMGLLRAL